MRRNHPTRRRAIAIFAATAGGLLFDVLSRRDGATHEWRGIAMGADARIIFGDTDAGMARATLERIVPEIDRLEQALSLFRENSEICRLNRDGILEEPSLDLRAAMALGLRISEASEGLFDPTVQALWETYVDWFANNPEGHQPPERLVAAARRRVNWRRIGISPTSIRLGPDQRITLNGLGQGYVTDRIAEMLRRSGYMHVLVDLGELRALGPRRSGEPWVVARSDASPIALSHGALATSEGSGCTFGANGDAHHLFDPRSGRSASKWRRVAVRHPSAAVADALSTALYAASAHEIERIIKRFDEAVALATARDGDERCWTTTSEPASAHLIWGSGRPRPSPATRRAYCRAADCPYFFFPSGPNCLR